MSEEDYNSQSDQSGEELSEEQSPQPNGVRQEFPNEAIKNPESHWKKLLTRCIEEGMPALTIKDKVPQQPNPVQREVIKDECLEIGYDPTDPDPKNPLEWITFPRNELDKVLIDHRFSGVPKTLKKLKGITLTGHQRRNIKAMMDLENTLEVPIKTNAWESHYSNPRIKTHAGRLSEKLGSGKTFIMLGLILSNKCPKIGPEIIRPPMYIPKDNQRKAYNRNPRGFYGFGYHFERSYKKYVNTNIIFVSSSVLVQWEKTIQQHMPKTKYMIISDVHALRIFESQICSGQYDKEITVVKNGTSVISGLKTIKASQNLKITKTTKLPIITSVAHILDSKQMPCKRLFIDDFDTINISRTAVLPTSLFYWIVSSTNRQPKFQSVDMKFDNVKDALMNFHPLVSGITENQILHNTLNVACKPTYTDDCVKLGQPEYYVYEYDNPAGNVAHVLNAFNLGNAQQIREAINADSPKDAAKLANIESTNPLDMLNQLLGDGKKKYISACKTLKYIKKVQGKLYKLPEAKKDRYPQKDIERLSKNIMAIKIKYNSPPIEKLLKNAEENATEIKRKNGSALDRARDSLGMETCTICCDDMEDNDIIMTRCCNQALCATCGFHSTINLQTLKGQCSKCRTQINIKDLIFIGKNFDVEKFTKRDVTDMSSESADGSESSSSELPAISSVKIPTNKRESILQLVQGKKLKCRKVNIQIDNLIVGKDALPAPPEKSKRFLVLSNHPEILKNLLMDCDKAKIPALQLHGTSKQKFAIIDEFRRRGKVLLINSAKDCAGMNLQFATDLIFCHKIIDHSTESQVAGRIQRMGCKWQVKIHYVLYNNEISSLRLVPENKP